MDVNVGITNTDSAVALYTTEGATFGTKFKDLLQLALYPMLHLFLHCMVLMGVGYCNGKYSCWCSYKSKRGIYNNCISARRNWRSYVGWNAIYHGVTLAASGTANQYAQITFVYAKGIYIQQSTSGWVA